ncbi:hypothetical protein GW915_03290 [bacterium]|nr:hypothetical protein [bacterium]
MKAQLIKLVTLSFTLASLPALAVYEEGQDRAIMEIRNANIEHASYSFETAQDVSLTMTRRDGKAGFLGFNFEAKAVVGGNLVPIGYKLEVTSIDVAQDGSTIYYATLPNEVMNAGAGHRVNLTLIDHSTSTKGDYKDAQWEVSIRDGYGWCGTMDSTIEFTGNPAPVYTIEQMLLPEI